jgi:hypothetical protein
MYVVLHYLGINIICELEVTTQPVGDKDGPILVVSL